MRCEHRRTGVADVWRLFVRVGAFVALAFAVTACSGDDEPDATATPALATDTPATAVPEVSATSLPPASATVAPSPTAAPVTATPEPASGLDALSLVYVDTRRGQGGEVYVADADGANPRVVTAESGFRRPLDVAGSTLAAVGEGGVLLIDLASGESRLIEEPRIVFDGAFFDAQTFFFSASGSCIEGGGALYRVELPSFESVELLSSQASLTIAGFGLNTNSITLVPRACDVGISTIEVHDALSGKLTNSLAVEGCGWAIAVPEQNKAVASWQACTPPGNHTGADATVYDFGIVGPTGHDVTVPDVRPNAAIWLPRPGHAEVALGATMSEGTGPGSERGAGIYVLDLATREFVQVVEGEGAEQYPVVWSPDGRFLLYSVVEAQGVCHFAYVDMEADAPEPVAIDPAITFCGLNGHVVGWTELP